jgi:hypothetical protein
VRVLSDHRRQQVVEHKRLRGPLSLSMGIRDHKTPR